MEVEAHVTTWLILISKILSVVVGLIGLVVMIGWVFDIQYLKSVFPKLVSMKVNTAISFIFISISIFMLEPSANKSQKYAVIAKFLAAIVFILGFLTTIEYVFNYDLHLDQLLLKQENDLDQYHPTGRMAPITAILIMLIGIVLMLVDCLRCVVVRQLCIFVLGSITLFILISFTYHVQGEITFVSYTYSALHTATNFVFVFFALLFMRPNEGIMKLLTSTTEGGDVARKLLPSVIMIPILLGYLRLIDGYEDLFNREYGLAIIISANIIIFVIFILYVAAKLMRSNIARMHAENSKNKYAAELQRSNQELQQFAYIASHDLQEPLRVITSYLELIDRRYKQSLDQDIKDFINFAVESAKRLQQMVNDLLIYSRVETEVNPFEMTESRAALLLAMNNLKLAIDESHASIHYANLPIVVADSHQLTLLFQNLMSNAIKFHKPNANPIIDISASRKENKWVFCVKDNGIGIDLKYKDKLFVIFKRLVGKQYSGSGIGLAVCKRIIDRHGGQIWVESEVGEGCAFYFTIPDREL